MESAADNTLLANYTDKPCSRKISDILKSDHCFNSLVCSHQDDRIKFLVVISWKINSYAELEILDPTSLLYTA